ncbi:hypothetical protein [Microbulbifer sp. TRSA001]|uniref:hypothetical protein n=1 Tax=unclassified Microbulbifer TaxID=2619833 RepID=UPI00403ABCD2
MRVKFKKKLDDQADNMTVDKEYVVLGIEGDSYRIICDEGEPYLYEPEQFDIVDSRTPDFWVRELGDDGELYAYPMAWFHNYFFESYFDNEPGFVNSFWKDCSRLYGIKSNA